MRQTQYREHGYNSSIQYPDGIINSRARFKCVYQRISHFTTLHPKDGITLQNHRRRAQLMRR